MKADVQYRVLVDGLHLSHQQCTFNSWGHGHSIQTVQMPIPRGTIIEYIPRQGSTPCYMWVTWDGAKEMNVHGGFHGWVSIEEDQYEEVK